MNNSLMKILIDNRELMVRSLKGLWVGDCIGNIGQLYFAHDILKALDEGIMKFGSDTINPTGQCFQLSDDTEEAIVLVNHLDKNREIKQDELAAEFAKRYYTRDPDGERFGYGLMTRKVLKEIYDGKPWREANQTKPRIEGPSFVDKMLVGITEGKSINQSMTEVNAEIQKKLKDTPALKVGSCGNGSAMRVAPLGAYFHKIPYEILLDQAKLQSEVTHCHPEGIAGAAAVALLTKEIGVTINRNEPHTTWTPKYYYDILLEFTPKGQVWDGIKKASELPLDTPIAKLIEVLGNGTHVTCQDTVPLCIFLTIRALCNYKIEEMYEKVIIETCKCFGDVDTNCAIVGGMIGIISPPPEKWVKYCEPMEGVLGEPIKEEVKQPINKRFTKEQKQAIKEAITNTKSWDEERKELGIAEGDLAAQSQYYKWLAEMETKPFRPNTGSCDAVGGNLPPTFSEMIEKAFPGKTYRL